MKVKDCMCTDVCCVKPETKISDIAKIMCEKHIGSVPVCDSNDCLCGIVTDRDIILRTVACEKDLRNTQVSDIMTKDVCACQENEEMEKAQSAIEHKISNIETIVDNIEGDIYEDDEQDEDYEFEVVCPYCNYEFSVDMDNIEKDEIECPECHNVIELDWNEEHCSGSCSHCMENCVQEDDETYNTNEKDTKKKEDKDNNEDDEDM